MVLERVQQLSKWQARVAASKVGTGNVVTGRGIALGTFAGTPVANVAEISVNRKTGKITPLVFYCAQDTGLTVYPDGVANQAVGSLVQGASRVLQESVAFNKQAVTSLDWLTYPIMRFKDSPTIVFDFVQRYDIPATSTGTVQANGTSAPSGTAAANGVFV